MTHASPGALLQVLIDKPTRKEVRKRDAMMMTHHVMFHHTIKVVELRVALSSKPLPWVDQFCEEGTRKKNRRKKAETSFTDDVMIRWHRCFDSLTE